MNGKTIRIFISSPGDVDDERQKAKEVILALQRFYDDYVTLIPVLWEDLPLPATASFQEGIELLLSERYRVDIAVFILWSKLGTPLSEKIKKKDGSIYKSGTEREFDLMLSAFEESGRKAPIVIAYTRNDDQGFSNRLDACSLDDENLRELIEQRKLAKTFIQERFQDKDGRNILAYHTYVKPVEFADRLNVHLRGALDDLLNLFHHAATWDAPPYRSLDVFDVEHAPIFCGRAEEICDLLQRLRDQEEEGCSFVCIVGASGSGKSSLARAGVAGSLTQCSFDDSVKEWRHALFMPSLTSRDVCQAFAKSLADGMPELFDGPGGVDHFAKRLESNPEAANDLISIAFEKASQKADGTVKLLLILDQMEELWTDRAVTDDQRERFLQIVEAIAKAGGVSILATLRSDYYSQAQGSNAFRRLKGDSGHFDLAAPGTASLQQVIVQPARRAGLSFERDENTNRSLDQLILEDANRDPSALPLLQFTLNELYKSRNRKKCQLTFAAYNDLGGIEGALERRLSSVYQDLPDKASEALDELFPMLVTIDSQSEKQAARRRGNLDDLRRLPLHATVTDALIAARFLTTDQDKDGVSIVSIAHESLLRKWPQLATWIDNNREMLRLRSQVEQSEERWQQSRNDPSLLLNPGLPLTEGSRLLGEAPELLCPDTIEFLNQSIAHSFAAVIESGDDLLNRSVDVKTRYPEVWSEVIAEAFESDSPRVRRNVASLLCSPDSAKFQDELISLLISDPDDSVAQAAAVTLILKGELSAYDAIRDNGQISDSRLAPKVYKAIARLLVVSDMSERRPPFADWFLGQERRVRVPAQLLSKKMRLQRSLPVFLFIVIPSAVFAVGGAASVKWLTSKFNYSCVQATAGAFRGLFQSAPSGIIVGGGIVAGLTLYRMVFGREHDKTAAFRPYAAIGFGAVFGLLVGITCVILIALVYQPEALQQMGWIETAIRPEMPELFRGLFLETRCGFSFPLTSIGLGIALALMTNRLRDSKQWPQFIDQQSAITSISQLWRIIKGVTRTTIPYAAPIPLIVGVFAFFALVAMTTADDSPNWNLTPLSGALLGGLEENVELRTIWKASVSGRALGLFGDSFAKMVGGYFSIVGMGLGIVIMRHGVQISPQKIHGQTTKGE